MATRTWLLQQCGGVPQSQPQLGASGGSVSEVGCGSVSEVGANTYAIAGNTDDTNTYANTGSTYAITGNTDDTVSEGDDTDADTAVSDWSAYTDAVFTGANAATARWGNARGGWDNGRWGNARWGSGRWGGYANTYANYEYANTYEYPNTGVYAESIHIQTDVRLRSPLPPNFINLKYWGDGTLRFS